MRSIVLPAILACAALVAPPARAATARVVEVHVVDPQARPLARVTVSIAASPSGEFHASAQTDDSGVVVFTVPDGKGSYRIAAQADELAPSADVVDLGARRLPRGEPARLEITLKPPGAVELFNRAVGYFRQGRLVDAESDLRRALELQPDLGSAWAALSLVLLQKSQPSWLAQAKRDGRLPSDADPTLVTGQMIEEALTSARKALAVQPDDLLALRAQYDALQRLDRTEEADQALTALAAKDSATNLAPLLFNAGANAGNAGDVERARSRFRQALERDPSLWQAHTALAELEVREQDLDQALRELDEALAIAPREKSVWQRKIELLKALGRVADAEAAERQLAALGTG